MNVGKLGAFIRDQRMGAKLSLRKAAGLAGVSIPYLSQVERGLRKPSADILQAIAGGLRISAETLYVQAGFLEERPGSNVVTAVMADPLISESQKQALLQIYRAFREEAPRSPEANGAKRPKASPRRPPTGSTPRPTPPRSRTTTR